MADIVSKLPYYDVFQIAFDARFQNWQQFYRLGFRQTSHYSYILTAMEDILPGLSSNLRRKIRILNETYYADTNVSLDEYWFFFQESYRQRARTAAYSKDQFFTLYHAAKRHNAAELVACRNEQGQIFSVACLFYDTRRIYSMFHTYDATTKLSTQPIVTLRSIALAKERGLEFDFEGSMIPGAAQYYSAFNSVREPYFIISNFSSKYRLLSGLRESAQALKAIVKG